MGRKKTGDEFQGKAVRQKINAIKDRELVHAPCLLVCLEGLGGETCWRFGNEGKRKNI
jgi:hypothetical protein